MFSSKNKMVIYIATCIAAFFALGFYLQYFVSNNDVENSQKYKSLVEESYVDGKFTLPRKKIEDFFRYEVFVEENKVIIDYNMTAEKGRQLQKIVMSAEKTEDGFKWKCSSGILLVKKDC